MEEKEKLKTILFAHRSGEIDVDTALSQILDANNINWKRNWVKFPYEDDEGNIRYYIPDFYLIDKDEYVETKGYETDKDKLKWKAFPHKLVILKWNDLKRLGVNV